jgi:polysaccharide export outer membrane protein
MEKYKKLWRNAVLMVLLGLTVGLTGCATQKIAVGQEVVVGRTSFTGTKSSQHMLFPEYHIAPGDILDVLYQVKSWVQQPEFKIAVDNVLTIRFVDHPELNETQYVRPDGKISLAYLGSIRVVGKTVDELTSDLKEKYKDHLNDVELYVIVEEFRSAIKELKNDLKTAPRGLSRLVTVRPDGYATFAMLGDIYVAGKTVPQMRDVLNVRYEEVLPGLACDLFLEAHTGSRVSVFGEVNQPGSYQIIRPTSIFEALSMAGSITSAARLDSVIVFRQKKDQVVATRLDLKTLIQLRGLRSPSEQDPTEKAFAEIAGEEVPSAEEQSGLEQNMFYLYPDDIVYVSRRRLNTAAQVMREVGDVLLFNGWSISFRDNLDILNN